ncbi:MAG: ribonuclease H-like domain-containing protein [Thermoanaerobaculia bacterium]|nr:ribonuclease H-like domain-containing protein [Thermoanaerobaculia bacterium]
MKRLVIDIETVGTPWEEHDPYVREYLIKGLSEAEAEEEKRRGALSPFTGRIVAIGVMNVDDERTAAFYEIPGKPHLETRREEDRTYISGSEKQILEKFWEFFDQNDRFITFNGRQFDGPFLMIRSAIHQVRPKRDLVGRRYQFHPNCDLREALNFMGTVYSRQMRFNLDLACKTFGIESSKSESVDGRAVETMYRAGKYREIADYCLEDVRATAELYGKLCDTILCWNDAFERADRLDEARRRSEARAYEDRSLPSEEGFMKSVEETSAGLAESIGEDEKDSPQDDASISERHQASVFSKLVKNDEEDDDSLPEVETP